MSAAPVVRCYLGLGSNLGDTGLNLNRAIDLLGAYPGIGVRAAAPFYRTAPVGYLRQDDFLNTVVEIETTLPPLSLLQALQQIENRLGRVRTVRWGPRTVDLDLLIYGQEVIALPQLQVPHPRMHERAFVLVPLADLNPGLLVGGVRASDLAARLRQQQKIEPA